MRSVRRASRRSRGSWPAPRYRQSFGSFTLTQVVEELRTALRRLLAGLRAGAVLDLEQSGRVTVETRFIGSAGLASAD